MVDALPCHMIDALPYHMVALPAMSYGRYPDISFHMYHVILMISICVLATHFEYSLSFPSITIISHPILPLTMAKCHGFQC